MKVQFVTILMVGAVFLFAAPNVVADPLDDVQAIRYCAANNQGLHVGDYCNYVSTCRQGEETGVGIYSWQDDEAQPELTQCFPLVPDDPVDPCPAGEVGQDVLGTGQPCVDPNLCEPQPDEVVCGVDDPTDPTPDLPGTCGSGVGTGLRINDDCYTVVVCQEGTGVRGTGITLATNGEPSETCINSYWQP